MVGLTAADTTPSTYVWWVIRVQCDSSRRLRLYQAAGSVYGIDRRAALCLRADGRAYGRHDDRTPEMDGVSGAMLWGISDEADDDVACVLRPAAIQVAFTDSARICAPSR